MIGNATEHELDGEAQLDYAPKGLICEIYLPDGVTSRANGAVAHSPALPGSRGLIVEDDFILALNLADRLGREGREVIGLASRVAKALAVLEPDRLDAVVLDLNLNGKMATDLAEALVSRRIPL